MGVVGGMTTVRYAGLPGRRMRRSRPVRHGGAGRTALVALYNATGGRTHQLATRATIRVTDGAFDGAGNLRTRMSTARGVDAVPGESTRITGGSNPNCSNLQVFDVRNTGLSLCDGGMDCTPWRRRSISGGRGAMPPPSDLRDRAKRCPTPPILNLDWRTPADGAVTLTWDAPELGRRRL